MYTYNYNYKKNPAKQQQAPKHNFYKIDFLWIRKSVLVEVDGGQEEAFTYFLVDVELG